jgi:hypothetical protein
MFGLVRFLCPVWRIDFLLRFWSLSGLIRCELFFVSVFFAPTNYKVFKIGRSNSNVVMRTMKDTLIYLGSGLSLEVNMNYEAHYDLSWFRPLLGGNSHTFIGLILKMNLCYKWVNRELDKFT